MFFFIGFFLMGILSINGQGTNECTAAAIAACGIYPCVQTGTISSCLCSDFTLQPTAALCNGGTTTTTVATTTTAVVIPNQCANAICPSGATCIPTNQNPSTYICLCPNNIIANPDCPTNPLPNNPCLTNNPCMNGGTCVVDQLTLSAVCICPTNTYGPKCANACRPMCDSNWCYNGGRCANVYGQSYCFCGQNYRGRRCELRYNRYNYVYLYHNPRR